MELGLAHGQLANSLHGHYCSSHTMKYTNGKKKQCIVKMLITHKICSG